MKNLSNLKGKELIEIHNKLNPENPISVWKKSKSVLIDLIKELESKADSVLAEIENAADDAVNEKIEATANDNLAAKMEADADKDLEASAKAEAAKVKAETIVELTLPLLATIVSVNEHGRTIGLPYSDILSRILRSFQKQRRLLVVFAGTVQKCRLNGLDILIQLQEKVILFLQKLVSRLKVNLRSGKLLQSRTKLQMQKRRLLLNFNCNQIHLIHSVYWSLIATLNSYYIRTQSCNQATQKEQNK